MPALFAVGILVGSSQVALFAAFGALATMMLVDFGGPMQERLQSMASLAVGGAVMITLGTLTSVNAWLAAAAMLVVGFAVLFAGCVSSVLVAASFALLLSFILPVCLPGSAADIPARLAGWGMSAAVAMVAIAVLWPAPEHGLLRDRVRRACEALAECLQREAAHLRGGPENASPAERKACFDRAGAAVSDLRSFFLASSSRPTDLTTQGRLLVRMVDELGWLDAVLRTDQELPTGEVADAVAEVRAAAAAVLDRSARLLSERGASTDELAAALATLEAGQRRLEDEVLREFPHAPQALELTTALAPSFRTREVGYAASLVGTNVTGVLLAERRSWWERLLGREPEGVLTPWRAARERAATHWRPRSVWMHNSIRGAIALALAVWVANESGLQHAFWVVLGTLSVLRSNALNTGQLVIRGIAGTILGFIVAAGILVAVGTDTRLLWAVLPLAVFGAGLAPAAISFAAGQAAFTITLVVLFNILEPAGWKVGLVRVEDVAIGCTISLLVGLLFWPRGAAAALRRELADAYARVRRLRRRGGRAGIAAARRRPGAAGRGRTDAGGSRGTAAGRRLPHLPLRAGGKTGAGCRGRPPGVGRHRPAGERRRADRALARRGRGTVRRRGGARRAAPREPAAARLVRRAGAGHRQPGRHPRTVGGRRCRGGAAVGVAASPSRRGSGAGRPSRRPPDLDCRPSRRPAPAPGDAGRCGAPRRRGALTQSGRPVLGYSPGRAVPGATKHSARVPDRPPTRRLCPATAAAWCVLLVTLAGLAGASAPAAVAGATSAAGVPPEIHLTDPADTHGPLDVRSMRLIQSTSDIVWRFATQRPFQISQMSTGKGRTACLFVHPKRSSAAEEEVCLTGKRGAHAMYRVPVGPHGKRAGWVAAGTSRPTPSSVVVHFPWAAVGLGRGRFDFSMLTVWAGTPACPAHSCRDAVPNSGVALWRIDRFRATGCLAAGTSERFNGPAAGRMVALSFDDGPSIYTPQVLAILNRYRVHATFFEIGEEVATYPGNSRKVIASGDVIGNHTLEPPGADHRQRRPPGAAGRGGDRPHHRLPAVPAAAAGRRDLAGRRLGGAADGAAQHRLGRRPARLVAARRRGDRPPRPGGSPPRRDRHHA